VVGFGRNVMELYPITRERCQETPTNLRSSRRSYSYYPTLSDRETEGINSLETVGQFLYAKQLDQTGKMHDTKFRNTFPNTNF